MNKLLFGVAALTLAGTALAEPEYVTMKLEIEVARPAAEVWDKVGGYCDIGEWMGIDCEITSGDGGLGTVRALLDGRITEILVGQTELSYGYTQPAVEGQFYNLYHGFMEARPVSANRSKIVYSVVWDVSNQTEEAWREEYEGRRARFQTALENMKRIAEAP